MEKNILWAILIITVVTSGSHRSEKSDILKKFVKLVVNHLNKIEVKNIKKQEARSKKSKVKVYKCSEQERQ